MPHARLGDRALLDVTGDAAEDFLQNLVTSDLDLLGQGEARPSALLTPQGKIMFDFLVSRIAGGLRLDVAAAARDGLLKRLSLYRLRAKVGLEASQEPVFAVWDETAPAPASAGWAIDRRFPGGSVYRAYGAAPTGTAEAEARTFEDLRIRAGIAEAEADFPASEVFPHDVLLDQNAGVSFRKGCYIGQEVVSRMQHRGTARRRIMLVTGERRLTTGAAIVADGKPIGTLLATVSGDEEAGEGLALIRIDRLAAALGRGSSVEADGVPVTASIPPWAGYALPDTAAATAADDEA